MKLFRKSLSPEEVENRKKSDEAAQRNRQLAISLRAQAGLLAPLLRESRAQNHYGQHVSNLLGGRK